jgi:hypothetical protein
VFWAGAFPGLFFLPDPCLFLVDISSRWNAFAGSQGRYGGGSVPGLSRFARGAIADMFNGVGVRAAIGFDLILLAGAVLVCAVVPWLSFPIFSDAFFLALAPDPWDFVGFSIR